MRAIKSRGGRYRGSQKTGGRRRNVIKEDLVAEDLHTICAAAAVVRFKAINLSICKATSFPTQQSSQSTLFSKKNLGELQWRAQDYFGFANPRGYTLHFREQNNYFTMTSLLDDGCDFQTSKQTNNQAFNYGA